MKYLLFSRWVMLDSLQPHGLQHTRPPCPPLSPGVGLSSCPLCPWYHSTTSSSATPFSFCLQSFPVFSNESALHIRWPEYWSFNFSISPSNEYSGLISFRTGLISLWSKGLSRVFSSTTVQKHQFFSTQPSFGPTLKSVHDYWKDHSFDYMNLCQQSEVSAF